MCARSRLSPQEKTSVCELLEDSLDWEDILRLAAHHGVSSFLFNHLSAVPRADGALSEVLNRLRAGLFGDIQFRMFLTRELLNLCQQFQTQGIPLLAYKGPALSFFLYQDVTFRPFSDLDILVRKKDFQKAAGLLRQMGYHFPLDRLTPKRRRAALRCERSYTMSRLIEGKRVIAELHWDIMPACFFLPVNTEDFWKRIQPIEIHGTRIFIHGVEDLLLTLCAHGCKDGWSRLWWLTDIAELIRAHPEIRWPQVMERAKTLGAQRILGLGLFLAHHLLRVNLLDRVLQKIASDREIPPMTEKVKECLLECNDKIRETLRSRIFFYWKIKERWQDRIRDAFHHILILLSPTKKEWEWIPLPDAFFFLYYFLRPTRLLKRYAGKMWAGLKK